MASQRDPQKLGRHIYYYHKFLSSFFKTSSNTFCYQILYFARDLFKGFTTLLLMPFTYIISFQDIIILMIYTYNFSFIILS